MAKIPLSLSRRANPQIGGPQSRASSSFGSGLQQLGQGISQAAITNARVNRQEEKLDVSKDVLRIQEASNLNQRSVLETSTDGQQVNEGIQEFQENIINEFSSGKSDQYREDLIQQTSGMFTKSRIAAANAGIDLDVNNQMSEVESSVDAGVRIARENPEDAESVSLLLEDIGSQLSDLVGVSEANKNQIKEEFINKVTVAKIQGFMDQGIHGAMLAKEQLSGITLNNKLSADQKIALTAQANSQIAQGQKQALASADTEIQNQLALEQGGRDTALTPEMMEQKLQGIGLPDAQIAARVTGVRRNKFYGQEIRVSAQMPLFQMEDRLRAAQNAVDTLAQQDVNMASDFAVEARAQLDALNDLETQKRADPYGYVLEWVPSIRDQDQTIGNINAAVQAAEAGSPAQESLQNELLAARQSFAANLKEQGQLLFGDANAIPIAGKNAVTFFKKQLDASPPEVQSQLVADQIMAYGPAAAGQVMKTFFEDRAQQAWQFIGPMLFANRRGADDAIAAHKNWNANKKLLPPNQLSEIKENSTILMAEFGQTFQRAATDSTFQAGIQLVQEIAADQLLRGVDIDDALENAVQIATGHFAVINNVRMSRANMSKYPEAQSAIENINISLVGQGSQMFNRAIADSLGFEVFPGDEGNQEFLSTKLTPYTSSQGDGITIMVGEGLNAIPILDANNKPLVFTWKQLNTIAQSVPQTGSFLEMSRNDEFIERRNKEIRNFNSLINSMISDGAQ